MPPSVIGRIAADANVKSLVLYHFLLGYHTLDKQSESQKEIARKYSGPIVFAKDLDCYLVKSWRLLVRSSLTVRPDDIVCEA